MFLLFSSDAIEPAIGNKLPAVHYIFGEAYAERVRCQYLQMLTTILTSLNSPSFMNLVKTLHALQNRIHSKFSHSLASSADRRKSHLMQISLAVQIHRKVQGLLIYQVLATTPQLTPAVPSLYPNWTRSKSVYPLARPYPLHSSWPTRVRDCLTLWIIGSSYR